MTVVSRPARRRSTGNVVPFPQQAPAPAEPPAEQGLTFSEFLEEFRQDFAGWSQVTWRGLSGALRSLEGEFGPTSLTQITPREIDRYLGRRRRDDGITAATCNRYLACLKTLFKQARIWGFLDELPTDALTMQKEASKVPEALTDEELERLLAQCPEPLHTIVALAADTGMRKSEIGRLQWGDCDFESGLITVRKTKNGRFRAIPMTARLQELLPKMLPIPPVPEAIVFCLSDAGRGLRRAAAEAGIPHVHMHRLRHTFATRLRDKGVPLDRIMELMGHSSYQMVQRYAHARPQQLVDAIEALNTPEGVMP